MPMATNFQAAVDISVVAWKRRVEIDNAFLQENQSLRRLELRAGRICRHDGSVVKRLVFIVDQIPIVFSSVASDEQRRVVARAGNQRKDFACRWFDGYDGSDFSLHEPFAVFLQLDVDAQRQVFAGDGRYVFFAVFVFSFDSAMRVSDEYFFAFDAAQIFFIAFLYAQVAGIVAGSIIGIFFNVVGIYFADVSEHVGC